MAEMPRPSLPLCTGAQPVSRELQGEFRDIANCEIAVIAVLNNPGVKADRERVQAVSHDALMHIVRYVLRLEYRRALQFLGGRRSRVAVPGRHAFLGPPTRLGGAPSVIGRPLCAAYPPVDAGSRAAGPDPSATFGCADWSPKSGRSSRSKIRSGGGRHRSSLQNIAEQAMEPCQHLLQPMRSSRWDVPGAGLCHRVCSQSPYTDERSRDTRVYPASASPLRV